MLPSANFIVFLDTRSDPQLTRFEFDPIALDSLLDKKIKVTIPPYYEPEQVFTGIFATYSTVRDTTLSSAPIVEMRLEFKFNDSTFMPTITEFINLDLVY
jgi:hypothetical protein